MIGAGSDTEAYQLTGGTLRSRDTSGGGTLRCRDAVMAGDLPEPSNLLNHLRQQRAQLLPSYEMFTFVYQALIEYFGSSRLI